MTPEERKLRQDVYIRVCKDSGFQLESTRAAILAANVIGCHPIEIWMAIDFDRMTRIASGEHPVCKERTEQSMTKPSLIEYEDGTREWVVNDRLHRTDGPAVEYADGTRLWYVNDKRHRTDGPAVEWADGTREWWINGELHRTDGPAVEWADGTRQWFINGEQVDQLVVWLMMGEQKIG